MCYAVIFFILANIYDYVLTQYGLKLNGVPEWNPVALVLIQWLGNIIGLMIFKLVLISIVVTASLLCYKRYAKIVLFVLSIGSIVIFLGGSLWMRYL